MRLGIMQPYFAPGLGYFDLINITDEWIVFDTAQYRRRSWMNRNRILRPGQGWQYITARTRKMPRETRISEVELLDGQDWRGLILRQLEHYRLRAPHYPEVVALVEEVLGKSDRYLACLNVRFLNRVCDLLGLSFSFHCFSKMNLTLGPVEGPGDWALRISEALGAKTYVNPPAGKALFDTQRFRQAGVELSIRYFEDLSYTPIGYEVMPGLSIIDVLMWNSPDRVRSYLAQQKEVFEAKSVIS